MSLVGTRPILQDELLKYELHHRARIAIKLGITGMWQVSGRSDITDFEEVVRLDTEYEVHCAANGNSVSTFVQKDLSAKTGITQADISRIENGTRNPSLSMVKKLAQGLGMQLKLEFVPMPTKNKM